MFDGKNRNTPHLFSTSFKTCKNDQQRIILRICRLIAVNLIDKAVELMKKNNIDINKNLKIVTDDILLLAYETKYPFYTFLHVAFTFSNFQAIKKLIIAGADPFVDYKYKNPIDTCETIIIPKLLYTIQPLLKKKIKLHEDYFSAFNLVNHLLEPFLKKKDLGF